LNQSVRSRKAVPPTWSLFTKESYQRVMTPIGIMVPGERGAEGFAEKEERKLNKCLTIFSANWVGSGAEGRGGVILVS